MKAYYVYHKDVSFDYNDFVLADTPGKAKYGCWFVNDVDWQDIRVRRVPKLDDIVDPTDRQIFEAGFLVCCLRCQAAGLYDPVFDEDDNSYCGEVCRSRKPRFKVAGLD